MALTLRSPDFEHNTAIPARYTCEGDNISPPLVWDEPPKGTKSLVLIVDDPDAPDPAAPKRVWVHWVIYNLPPTAGSLPAGVFNEDLPKGALAGKNDRDNIGYNGPCPPIGTHRYYHKLYAVDIVLPDMNAPTKAQVLEKIEGHILEYSELMGLYKLTVTKN